MFEQWSIIADIMIWSAIAILSVILIVETKALNCLPFYLFRAVLCIIGLWAVFSISVVINKSFIGWMLLAEHGVLLFLLIAIHVFVITHSDFFES